MQLRRSSVLTLLAAVMLVFVAGCGGGGGEQPATTEEETQTEETAGEMAEQAAGSLAVTVQFEGDAPAPKEHDASGNPECNTDTVEGQQVVANDNGTLKNVVVTVEDGPTDPASGSDKNATIDQENCLYVPHVVTLGTNGTLTIKDSDENLHNVRGTTLDGKQLFNKTTFKGQSVEVAASTFDGPGFYSLECNVHPWMQAYVHVTDHGHAGVTDEQGSVSLAELPAGDYTIKAWHEKYGEQTQTVTVSGDEETSLSFTYTAGS